MVPFATAAPAGAVNDEIFPRQWGLAKIGAPTAWNAGLFGEGIDIAIVDTGVHLQHQDLAARLVGGRNYITPDAPPQDDQCDDDPMRDSDPETCQNGGHGTHVAGIAAAGIDNGGTVGVAPKARIMPVKVLGEDGSGSFASAASGIRWAADNGADVINLSLGSDIQGLSGTPSVLNDAVRYAWSKGVICVFAAGNSFVLGSGFSDEPALVVSATNRDDQKPDFSSGVGEARWALAAPGGGDTVQFAEDENIWSTVWTSDARGDTYSQKRGTSMAAPFVAGAAAVLRGAGLSPQQTVDRLLATAKDLGPSGRDNTFGAGRLDVAKAVQGLGGTSPAPAAAPTTAAPPPQGAAAGPSPTTTARRARGGGAPAPAQPPATAAPAEAAPEGAALNEIAPEPSTTETPNDGFFGFPTGNDNGQSEPSEPSSLGWILVAAGALAAAGGGIFVVRRRGPTPGT